jgi:hypothetical protein
MIKVKITGGPTVYLGTSMESLLRVQDMQKLGNFAVQTIVARTRSGVGSNGLPFPPLKSSKVVQIREDGKFKRLERRGYAAWKIRKGLAGIRDMWGTGEQGGHMLDNFSVRSVSEMSVRMAFTKKRARQKARGNEARTPFLGYAPQDRAKIAAEANRLFGSNVRDLGVFGALRAFRKKKAA